MTRSFEDKPAVREATPLLIGLIGPSGTGKTYSALRLATGIQRVSGGDIHLIDTEARRGLHYAEKFKFRHIPFSAPFSPLDYIDALEHAFSKGAKIVIVDSTSHEHEGPGGVLEEHAKETERLAKAWKVSEEKAQMSAWAEPKGKRRKLITTITQQAGARLIFCFRAKPKVDMGGPKPVKLGFMPIAGEEFVYEMSLKCLLLPGADGVPTWSSKYIGEQMMIKIPEQFRELFACKPQLSEDIGEELARWAAGAGSKNKVEAVDVDPLLAKYAACATPAELEQLEAERLAVWKFATKDGARTKLKDAAAAAATRLAPNPEDDGRG